jgi:hypothetical protein
MSHVCANTIKGLSRSLGNQAPHLFKQSLAALVYHLGSALWLSSNILIEAVLQAYKLTVGCLEASKVEDSKMPEGLQVNSRMPEGLKVECTMP